MYTGKKARVAALVGAALCLCVFVPLLTATGAPTVSRSSGPPLFTSPPLFATAGERRSVGAVVPGTPASVTLVAERPGGRRTTTSMRATEPQHYAAALPPAPAGGLSYSVVAEYADRSVSSDVARLHVLDDVGSVDPVTEAASPHTLLTVKVGEDLGAAQGKEGATIIPPSFAVDEARGHVVMLDTVNSRVVTFDADGERVATTTLQTGTKTASDLVLNTDTGSVLVLDQMRDQVIELAGTVQSVVDGIGLRDSAHGARLTYDAAAKGAYVADLDRARVLPAPSDAHDDIVPLDLTRAAASVRHVSAEVAQHSVTFGVTGAASRGVRVEFDDEVLDAADTVVDEAGTVWSLVGLYNRASDSVSMVLAQVDPTTGAARTTPVGTSVPGDVTRRLSPLAKGVALLEGEGDTLSVVKFEDLSGGAA